MTHPLSFDHTPKEARLTALRHHEVALLWSRRRTVPPSPCATRRPAITSSCRSESRTIRSSSFNHPFAYAASRGLATSSTAPAKRAA